MTQLMQDRVAICKDAIAQIRCGKYSTEEGYYFQPRVGGKEISEDDYKDVPLNKVIEQSTCEICAKGAIFASWTRLHGTGGNYGQYMEVADEEEFICSRQGVFSASEMDLLEFLYENATRLFPSPWSWDSDTDGKGWSDKEVLSLAKDLNQIYGFTGDRARGDITDAALICILHSIVMDGGSINLDTIRANATSFKETEQFLQLKEDQPDVDSTSSGEFTDSCSQPEAVCLSR